MRFDFVVGAWYVDVVCLRLVRLLVGFVVGRWQSCSNSCVDEADCWAVVGVGAMGLLRRGV
jgi:hypothetical protein